MSASKQTSAMLSALLWLRNRNGDGVFDRNQILVAGGQRAPYMRGTWTKLAAEEMVEFYHDRRRVRVTDFGHLVNLKGVKENLPCEEDMGA
ncbi:hypothetical protein [Mesorhizobium sp. ESP-6-2]|uniref:hypothetical protein n=1 Tax=Mesorhizobium sp. ESP-6-2 TaxID=2876625 RepID=UPI001CCD6E7C|nr:hypothetical protein [Mesorhizobium sp. ESP-6-2]MBZ9807668.1 hypothetical protein [Mesorhizobium sp. ESP-6-2]